MRTFHFPKSDHAITVEASRKGNFHEPLDRAPFVCFCPGGKAGTSEKILHVNVILLELFEPAKRCTVDFSASR